MEYKVVYGMFDIISQKLYKIGYDYQNLPLVPVDTIIHMGHITRKPVFMVSDFIILKPACSAN